MHESAVVGVRSRAVAPVAKSAGIDWKDLSVPRSNQGKPFHLVLILHWENENVSLNHRHQSLNPYQSF